MNPAEVSVTSKVETMTISDAASDVKDNDAKPSAAPHVNFAGRYPAGIAQPITIGKNGVRHVSFVPAKHISLITSTIFESNEPFFIFDYHTPIFLPSRI